MASYKIQKFLIPLAACFILVACHLGYNQPAATTEVKMPSMATTFSHLGEVPVYCKAGRGSALFGHTWYDFQDTSFRLFRGERVDIQIPRKNETEAMTIQGLFDENGQKMVFCPVLDVPAGHRIACTSIYMLEDDLQSGIKRTFDIPNAIRGAAITCAYMQENLKSLNTPAAGGN
jgi:hypothetical protein